MNEIPIRWCLLGLAVGSLALACAESPPARPAPPSSTSAIAGQPSDESPIGEPVPDWDLQSVANLGRLESLADEHRAHLRRDGFFLAEQPTPDPAARRPAYVPSRATHLFHVYERNDYIAFPSLVTVDLAIDATHAYFDAVLKEIEEKHLVPRLRAALAALLSEAEKVRAAARTADGKAAARRAVVYWSVALQLLDSPAPDDAPDAEVVSFREDIGEDDGPEAAKASAARKPRIPPEVPASVRAEVSAAVRAIQVGSAALPANILNSSVDLTQMRPRGHYHKNGVLQRFFRSMSWLGMARFAVGGKSDDVVGVALLARSWIGSEDGRKGLEAVHRVTSFFAGESDSANLAAAAAVLTKVVDKPDTATADQLVGDTTVDRLRAAFAELPTPQIASEDGAGEVRVLGRRAFADAVAIQSLIEPVIAIAGQGRAEEAVTAAFGALGPAAALGSELSAREMTAGFSPDGARELRSGIEAAREHIAQLDSRVWSADAYHGTMHALRVLLEAPGAGAPNLLRTEAWRRRALQAFAGGWAELRHDTILYGEQLGAECDAPDPGPPPGWVEPVPEVYARLAAMVGELDKRLRAAGIPVAAAGPNPDDYYYRPLADKTKMWVEFLDDLRAIAEHELAGKPLTVEQRQQITLIGGRVEWMLITLANTDLLSRRDQDMAVVADVFTWKPGSQALEVAVAHPDLIYAIIPGPAGPVVARGAVMSYREFLRPMADRMTDEAWRSELAAGRVPERPAWMAPVYAAPVPAIAVGNGGVDRCGPSSGNLIEL